MNSTGPRIPLTAAVLVVLFALLLGFWGNSVLQGMIDRPEDSSATDLDTGDVEQRTDRLGLGVTPEPEQVQTEPEPDDSPPGRPVDDAELQAIRERLAADLAWREERARRASDSPLTPGVTDTAGMAVREGDPEQPPAAHASPETVSSASGPGLKPLPSPAPLGNASPESPVHLLARGSVIPAVLRSPVDSELPGLVLAQVTETVFDTVTGGHALIPRGSQIVGVYDSGTATGQRRMFLSWTDLRMPDGTPLDLQEAPALGSDGVSGVKGRRRTGLAAALGAAVLFDLAGNATQIITGFDPEPQRSDLAALIAGATGNATSRVGQEYHGRLLDRGPRFRVRAGTLINVLVEEDMHLPSLGGA